MKDQKSLSALKKFIVVGTASVLCSTMLALPSVSATPGSDFTTAYSATTGTLLTESLWMGIVNNVASLLDSVGAVTTATSGTIKALVSTETCDGSIAGAIRYESGSAQICNGESWGSLAPVPTDTTPNAITFTNQTDVNANATITSDAVGVSGFDGTLTAVCGTNCTGIQRNGTGSWATSLAGFVVGDTITIRLTSAAAGATKVATVSLGNTVSANWSVTSYNCGGVTVAYSGGPYDSAGTTRNQGGYYRTVQVGTQCWLKDSLNAGTKLASASTLPTNNASLEKWCYADTDANCNTDGGLYQWDEMMNYTTTAGAQGICPTGWHLPTNAEYVTLIEGQATPGCSATFWGCAPAGTNLAPGGTSGLELLLPGIREDSNIFAERNVTGLTWSSSENGSSAWFLYRYPSYSAGMDRQQAVKAKGKSVRCLKN